MAWNENKLKNKPKFNQLYFDYYLHILILDFTSEDRTICQNRKKEASYKQNMTGVKHAKIAHPKSPITYRWLGVNDLRNRNGLRTVFRQPLTYYRLGQAALTSVWMFVFGILRTTCLTMLFWRVLILKNVCPPHLESVDKST